MVEKLYPRYSALNEKWSFWQGRHYDSHCNRTVLSLCAFGITLLLVLLFTVNSAALAHGIDLGTDVATDGNAQEGWLPFATLLSGVADPGVIVHDGAIHVIGGQSPDGPTDLHIRLDPQTHRAEPLAPLPVPRADAVAAVLDDTLYILGGYNVWYGGAVDYVHGYDVAANRWITATAMITPVSGAAGVPLGEEITVFGGFDNTSETAMVQSYQPASDTWHMRPPMPVARSEFAAVELAGKAYLIGGNIFDVPVGSLHVLTDAVAISSTLVSVYDPSTASWGEAAPLPAPRVDAAAIVRDGKIYVTGGTDRWMSGAVRQEVFIYTPETDSWQIGPNLRTARSGHRSAVVNEKLYVVGGYDSTQFPMATVSILDTIAATIYLPLVSSE